MNRERYEVVEWILGLFVVSTSLAVWLQVRGTDYSQYSIYDIFPLFGLLAFGLMWTHYVNGALRRYWNIEQKKGGDIYWMVSTMLVLALIVLHPLLLNIGLVRDGFGLPPASYSSVYSGKEGYLFLGTSALLVFLAFELRRWYKKASWWKYVEYLQLAAMVAIFVHALSLGTELTVGWYMLVWWGLGISLVAAVAYSRMFDAKEGNV